MDRYLLDQHAELEASHWWFVARRLVIADVLDRLVRDRSEPPRILDVGCGAGSMLGMLTQRGPVVAIDVSADAVSYVRERHPTVAVALGDLPEGLPSGPRFDVITALDVIEHIDDDVAALTAIRRSLVPGGALICTVPAYQWLWGPHDEISHHKRRYTRRHLIDSLGRARFDVEWASYYNTILFPAVAGVRLLRRAVGRDLAPSSDLSVRMGPFNGVLLRMFAVERHALRCTRLPFGVSLLVALARRSDS